MSNNKSWRNRQLLLLLCYALHGCSMLSCGQKWCVEKAPFFGSGFLNGTFGWVLLIVISVVLVWFGCCSDSFLYLFENWFIYTV